MTFTDPEYVLAVPDLAKTTAWWRDVMGFKLDFEVEGWSFLSRGDVALRLGECPDAIPPSELGDHQFFAFVFVDDVDAFHAEIVERGAKIQSPRAASLGATGRWRCTPATVIASWSLSS